MTNINLALRKLFLTLIPLTLLVAACKEEDPEPIVSQVTTVKNEANAYVNSWIQENMEYWYLWNDELPEDNDKNVDPQDYFEGLRHRDDRFSWIQNNYNDLLNALQGVNKEAGYEYVLYREKEGSDEVMMQVLYTKPASPAETAGLKRGDVITHINGQRITTGNYKDLLQSVKSDHTIDYKPLLVEEEAFGEVKTASLTAVSYAENPNYMHRIIETGGRKIGYFLYNFFAPGTDSAPGKYDAETDAIFADFKARGITDLVVDLRFNSGGSESSARKLASLIGRGVGKSKVFLKRQYNDRVQAEILNDDELGENFLVSEFMDEPNNVGTLLSSGRVYILTSSRTASASELIINALKPFMEVFLIGDTTYGKNVGSVSLFEEKDPKNLWGLQPIVVKVYNSLDQSDYSNGFTPDVIHKDNSLFLYPLGDSREALLSQAIAQITGTATTARVEGERRKPVAYSLDFRRGGFDLIMDDGVMIAP